MRKPQRSVQLNNTTLEASDHRPRGAGLIAVTGLALLLGAAPAALADRSDQRAHPGHHEINLAQLEERLTERFASLDGDSDGRVTETEFLSAERPAGDAADGRRHRFRSHNFHSREGERARRHFKSMDPEQRAERRAQMNAQLFNTLDTDGDGQLSATEFDEAPNARKALRKESHRKARFAKLDTNDDAAITEDEMLERLNRLRELDSNADGSVDREELRAGRAARQALRRG